MSYIANSPHGPQSNASWNCFDCPTGSHGDPRGAEHDTLRTAAIAHLEVTGHRVSVARGTLEVIYPMATTATGAGAS